MKKLVMFAVIGLFLSTTAFARIIVLQDGKTTSYKSSEKVVVNAKTPASVLFDGVLIKVPANKKKVTFTKEGGKIYISGTDLKDIEIAGKKISSNGQTTVAFLPETKEITVVKGKLVGANVATAKDTTKKTVKTTATKPASVTPVVTETVEFPEVSDYVNEIATQQTVEDIEDLSQSSPTGA